MSSETRREQPEAADGLMFGVGCGDDEAPIRVRYVATDGDGNRWKEFQSRLRDRILRLDNAEQTS